ncbi:MAG: hypothetical protein ABIJ18_01580 [archaeon]
MDTINKKEFKEMMQIRARKSFMKALIVAEAAVILIGGSYIAMLKYAHTEITNRDQVMHSLTEILDTNKDEGLSYQEWEPVYEYLGICPPDSPTLSQLEEFVNEYL